MNLLTLEQWLKAYCYLTGLGEPAATLHNLILKGSASECAFAVLTKGNETVACGLGVVERRLFGTYTYPEKKTSRSRAKLGH